MAFSINKNQSHYVKAAGQLLTISITFYDRADGGSPILVQKR